MEIMSALEQKIENLVSLIKNQKDEISFLIKENHELKDRIVQLEEALLSESNKAEQDLKKERDTAKQAVDDLIKSIDDLIKEGNL